MKTRAVRKVGKTLGMVGGRTWQSRAAAALALGVLFSSGAVQAESLNLICRLREARADGARRTIQRRLDFDLAARTVAMTDNDGHGWRFRRQFGYLSADADRIRLESGGDKESWVDRRSGEYFLRNDKEGLTVRGACQKATAPPRRF